MNEMIGKVCVIRSSPSGVWFGTVMSITDRTVTLENGRRVWYWTGAASCSGLANHGPGAGSKIPDPVPTAVVFDVCEILIASDEAIARLAEVPAWKA